MSLVSLEGYDGAPLIVAPVPHPAPSVVVYAEPQVVTEASAAVGGAHIIPKKTAVPESSADAETVEVLNAVLPPREWMESNGVMWRQYVLHLPATRDITAAVQRKLDAELVDRQARPGGLCSIREELFSQTFDEVIREVTLRCPERGLMLLRVRDELRMTQAAYATLYNSSTAYGTRCLKRATEGIERLRASVDEAKTERLRSEARLLEATAKLDALQRSWAEQRAEREKERLTERNFWLYQNTQLQTFVAQTKAAMAEAEAAGETLGPRGAAFKPATPSSSEDESDGEGDDDGSV